MSPMRPLLMLNNIRAKEAKKMTMTVSSSSESRKDVKRGPSMRIESFDIALNSWSIYEQSYFGVRGRPVLRQAEV